MRIHAVLGPFLETVREAITEAVETAARVQPAPVACARACGNLPDPAPMTTHGALRTRRFAGVSLFPAAPSPLHVYQGGLGNCGFVATLASFAATPDGRARLRSLITETAPGCYVVHLHQRGADGVLRAVDVRVDDDVYVDAAGHPVYAAASEGYWVSLIEKAAAQMRGGYDSLAGIGLEDTFTMLLGDGRYSLIETSDSAVTNATEARDRTARIESLVRSARTRGAPVILATHETDMARIAGRGLYPDHAYAVIDLERRNGETYLRVLEPNHRLEPGVNPADSTAAASDGTLDGAFWVPAARLGAFYWICSPR
ncbi:MAG: hypothetical protein IT381_13470 [Deltaproteobacteria bacterium]|nr:hypothetical protein [Deltaproteobacteria bacterium]